MTTIRPADHADVAQLSSTLASAFSDDPLFQWMVGGAPGRSIEPKTRRLFGATLRMEVRRSDHLVFTDEDSTGAAVWKAPNEWKMSVGDMMRLMPTMLRVLGVRVPRMAGAISAIEKVHPEEEHYYLEALGTRQDLQGKGIGSAVIAHVLDRCDEEGLPAYLESSNPRNIPFYARHGFEVTREIDVGKGAPTVTAMWRQPR